MKPQNIKERRSTFLKFLLLFVLTMSLLIGAFYFDYKVPVKENIELRKSLRRMKQDQEFQQDFSQDMVALDRQIESLNTDTITGIRKMQVEQDIEQLLHKMLDEIPEQDSIFNASMYNNIVKVFFDNNDARKQLQQLKSDFGEGNELMDELTRNRELINDLKSQLLIERMKNR